MKKLFLICMIALTVIGLVSCKESEDESSASSSSSFSFGSGIELPEDKF